MKFKVDRSKLLSGLSLAMSAIENKATVPFSGLVEIRVGQNNLIVYSTNVDLAIKVKVPVETDGTGNFAVSASRLHDWLNNTPDGELSVSVDKRMSMKIGASKCSIAISNAEIPQIPVIDTLIAEVPGAELSQALSRVASVIPTFSDARFNLNGTRLTIAQDGITATSCDGRRAVMVFMPTIISIDKKKDFLISKKASSTVASLATSAKGGLVKIFEKDSLLFGFGDRAVYARGLYGQYPDTNKVFPEEKLQNVISVNRKDLISVLSRVSTLAEKDSKAVTLRLSEYGDSISVFSNSSDGGDAEDTLASVSTNGGLAIKLNGAWLLDAARNSITDECEIRIIDSRKQVEVRDSGSSNFKYVLAPMNLD